MFVKELVGSVLGGFFTVFRVKVKAVPDDKVPPLKVNLTCKPVLLFVLVHVTPVIDVPAEHEKLVENDNSEGNVNVR